MGIVMVSDFLEPEEEGIFTTQYSEPNEILLKHNKSDVKVKLVKETGFLTSYMFSYYTGWVEILREEVSGLVEFFPMSIPKADEKTEARKRQATLKEYRLYNGLRYLKNLAIILGENPEDLDAVGFSDS